jgi:hypothetical protein
VTIPFTLPNEEYQSMHFVYGFCNGNASAAIEKCVNFHNEESQLDVCSVTFTNNCEKVAYFRLCQLQNIQYNRLWIRRKILLKWHSAVHMSITKKSPPAFMFHK